MTERQSVNFPGFAHQNPIPNASRIGNVMMSSVISGVDPGTRNLPPDLASQVANISLFAAPSRRPAARRTTSSRSRFG
jgi:2-iminobutanoate/2-iminopropanoate deaminase